MDQDVMNWLPQVIKELHDLRSQVNDVRSEMRSQIDDLRAHIDRNDQMEATNTHLVENLKAVLDAVRGDIGSTQSSIEGKIGNLDSKLDSIKSTVVSISHTR